MRLTDQQLAETYRQGARHATGLDDAALLELARSGANPAAAAVISRNAATADELLLLHELTGWADLRKTSPRRAMWALAAVLLGALGLTTIMFTDPAHDEPMRSSPSVDFQPADGQRLTLPPPALQWTPVVGAQRYQVTLYDAQLEPIWTGPWQTEARIELSADMQNLIGVSPLVFWRVNVSTGLRRHALPLKSFQVVPP